MMTPLWRLFLLCAIVCTRSILGQESESTPHINIKLFDENSSFDTVIFIGPDVPETTSSQLTGYPDLYKDLQTFKELDDTFLKHVSVHTPLSAAGTVKRVIFSPTGNLACDTADSRNIYDAATKAASMAYIAAVPPTPLEGVENAPKPNILIILGTLSGAPENAIWAKEGFSHLNAALGALYGLYVPREIRLARPFRATKYDTLYIQVPTKGAWVVKYAEKIEMGRWYARDICGGDPETMNPQEVLKYIDSDVKYNQNVVKQQIVDITEEDYPLVAAVNRASKKIDRFNGKIVKLTYEKADSNNQVQKSLYFVGSGMTMDTGGLDLKVSNTMPGHHRDKCGAAAIIGFFKMLEQLQPDDIKAKASLAILRNNIGSESYSTDEIIMAKSGKRVKIGYTDAEARIFLSDLLYEQIQESESDDVEDKQFYAIASFTEHVTRMYRFIMGGIENGVSKAAKELETLEEASDLLSDPLETTAVRWEDYDTNRGPLETEDLRNSAPEPLVSIYRGSQIAAAFLIQASRMEEHGRNTARPLKFIYLDVTGSAGNGDTVPTASPMTTLAARYLIKET